MENDKVLRDPETGLVAELTGDRGGILIRGFWIKGTNFILDVRKADLKQPYYKYLNPSSALKSAQTDNKKNHLEPCLE